MVTSLQPNDSEFQKIFISYALEDEKIAKEIYWALKLKNLNVFWDKAFKEEADIERRICRELSITRFLVLCKSKHTIRKMIPETSGFLRYELDLVLNYLKRKRRHIEVIVVNLDKDIDIDIRVDQNFYFDKEHPNCIESICKYIQQRIIELPSYNSEIENDMILSSAMKEHDIEKALIMIDKVLTKEPNHYDALNFKGALLNNIEKYNKAIRCLKKAIKQIPDAYEAMNNLGASYVGKKSYKKAHRVIDKSILSMPSAHDSWVNKCKVFVHERKYEEAVKVIEKGLENVKYDSGKSILLNAKGYALLNEGKLEEALSAFEKSIKKDKNNPEPRYNLDEVHEAMHRELWRGQSEQFDLWDRKYYKIQ